MSTKLNSSFFSKLTFVLLSIFLFIISLSIILINDNFVSWSYFNLLSWIALTATAMAFRESILSLYFFYFGVVFVLPPIIISPKSFYNQGLMIKEIYVPTDLIPYILGIISLFVLFGFISLLFTYQLAEKNNPKAYSYKIKYKFLFYVLYFISFFTIVNFNTQEAIAVFNEGYGALKGGDLSIQKNIIIFIIELIFISMTLILVYSKKLISLLIFFIYTISLIFIGERLPPILFFFFLTFIFFRIPYKSMTIVIASILLFFLGAPLLMVFASFREGLDIASEDFLNYYVDIWNVIGHSFDTLKASVLFIDHEIPVDISPFSRFYTYLDVIFSRLFDIDLNINGRSFGHQLTEALDPAMFDMNRTFSSSGIAESFYFFGFTGIFFYLVLIIIFTNLIKKHSIITSPINIMIFTVLASKFFTTVRGQLFGSIFDAIMQLMMITPFLMILTIIFLKKRT